MTRVILDAALLVGAVAWMVRQGFSKYPGRFLTWPMYNRVIFYRVHLSSDEDGQRIIPWDDMIFIDYGGGLQSLEEYLNYLQEVRKVHVSGSGVLVDASGYRKLRIRASHVDLE